MTPSAQKNLTSKSLAFLSLLALGFSLLVSPAVQAAVSADTVYTDVTSADWFLNSTTWGLNTDLLDSKKTEFHPHNQIIRADAAVILHRYLGESTYTGLSVFTDVPEGTYYTAPVNAMAKDSVITGYLNSNGLPSGKFGSLDPLTRAQAALLIVRISEGKFDSQVATLPFSDVDASHYGYDALSKLYGAKVIVGYPDGTVRPNASVTRAEFMEMLYKAFDPKAVTPSEPTKPVTPTDPVVDPVTPTDPVVDPAPADPSTTYPAMNSELVTFDAGGFNLTAYVTRPAGPALPTVVILHGCGGAVKDNVDPTAVMELESQYRDIGPSFSAKGYNAVVVDSFTGRRLAGLMDAGTSEICNTGGDILAEADRQMDAQKVLAYLKKQDYVKADQFGLLGFSHGGSTAMHAVDENNNQGYKAAGFVYPGCGLYGADWFPKIPTVFYGGSADTTTSFSKCFDRVEEIEAAGASEATGNPVEIHEMDGATHSYYPDKDKSQANMDAFLATEKGLFDFFALYLK